MRILASLFLTHTAPPDIYTLSLHDALPICFGSGAMTLYFQITIAEASRQEERGSALALGGLGWGISHLSTPLVMGLLADSYGIVAGFYALGAFALACTLSIRAVRDCAISRP